SRSAAAFQNTTRSAWSRAKTPSAAWTMAAHISSVLLGLSSTLSAILHGLHPPPGLLPGFRHTLGYDPSLGAGDGPRASSSRADGVASAMHSWYSCRRHEDDASWCGGLAIVPGKA